MKVIQSLGYAHVLIRIALRDFKIVGFGRDHREALVSLFYGSAAEIASTPCVSSPNEKKLLEKLGRGAFFAVSPDDNTFLLRFDSNAQL